MKPLKLLFLAACSATMLAGCGKNESGKIEINVFAAASMTETLNYLKVRYEALNSNITVNLNLDSSGTLKTQIQNGAVCDLFISAAPKQMNALRDLDLVYNDTRIDLLENKVALATSQANPKNVTSFDNMANRLVSEEGFLLGMGNEDVPVGQYTQKILQYYGISEEIVASAGKISYGSNVKAVTTLVANEGVACGVIYQTDAFSANLHVVDTATAEMCGQVIYPAALIKNGQQIGEAARFFQYLQSDEAMTVFEYVGFSRISQQ